MGKVINMSNIKTFTFHYQDEEYNRKEENIDSRGYKKAVKSFQNKYPKAKNVVVMWVKKSIELSKLQKLPLGRKKKLGR